MQKCNMLLFITLSGIILSSLLGCSSATPDELLKNSIEHNSVKITDSTKVEGSNTTSIRKSIRTIFTKEHLACVQSDDEDTQYYEFSDGKGYSYISRGDTYIKLQAPEDNTSAVQTQLRILPFDLENAQDIEMISSEGDLIKISATIPFQINQEYYQQTGQVTDTLLENNADLKELWNSMPDTVFTLIFTKDNQKLQSISYDVTYSQKLGALIAYCNMGIPVEQRKENINSVTKAIRTLTYSDWDSCEEITLPKVSRTLNADDVN